VLNPGVSFRADVLVCDLIANFAVLVRSRHTVRVWTPTVVT